MDTLPLPEVGDTITRIAGLSPAAQVVALAALGCCVCMWIWSRRPIPGPDAATVVEALKLTAQAQAETAASMATIAKQVEAVAEDVRTVVEEVRGLTSLALTGRKTAA